VLLLNHHAGGIPLVDDQGAAEEFAADAADETFGDRVGPRHARRVSMLRPARREVDGPGSRRGEAGAQSLPVGRLAPGFAGVEGDAGVDEARVGEQVQPSCWAAGVARAVKRRVARGRLGCREVEMA
jgi:hypothetical protein